MKITCAIDTETGTCEFYKDGPAASYSGFNVASYFMDGIDNEGPKQYVMYSHEMKCADGSTTCTYGSFIVGDKNSNKEKTGASFNLFKSVSRIYNNIFGAFALKETLLNITKKN
jgi:hypothetical protein